MGYWIQRDTIIDIIGGRVEKANIHYDSDHEWPPLELADDERYDRVVCRDREYDKTTTFPIKC